MHADILHAPWYKIFTVSIFKLSQFSAVFAYVFLALKPEQPSHLQFIFSSPASDLHP